LETACSGLLEIYVDGATEGKPEPAGICRVLMNISCQVILSFLSPVRWKDSNERKVLALDKCFNAQKKDSQPI
jgi:ribonuclease HI